MALIARTIGLSTKVSHSPAATCSEDGIIAVTTDDGVAIFTLQYDLAEKEPKLSYQLCKVPVTEQICQFDVDRVNIEHQISQGCLLHDVRPNTSPAVQSMQSFRGYKAAKWSPLGADCLGRSVLATLTLDHRLSIYSLTNKRTKWTEIVQLSEIYNAHMKKKNFSSVTVPTGSSGTKAHKTYQTFKRRIYSLAALGIAWLPELFKEDATDHHTDHSTLSYALLAVIMQSGDLVVWKVGCPATSKSVKLAAVHSCGDVHPTAICWCGKNNQFSGLVAVGFMSGMVSLYQVSKSKGDDGWTIEPIRDLWNIEDKIQTSVLTWSPQEEILLAGKGPYLMAFSISMSAPATEDTTMQHLLVSKQLPINCIWYNKSTHYMSTASGDVYRLHVQRKGDDIRLETSAITIPRDPSVQWRTHGLCCTPNEVYLLVVDSPSGPYCHLTLREPLKIHFLEVLTEAEVADSLLKATGRLPVCRDALSWIKNHCLMGEPFHPSLSRLMKETSFDAITDVELKIQRLCLFWKCLTVKPTDDPSELNDLKERIPTVEKELSLRHVKKSLHSLAEMDSLAHLSEKEKLSVCIMCQFVRHLNCSEMDTLVQKVCRNLETHEDKVMSMREACIVCQSSVLKVDNHKTGSCENGHLFSRCCQSLLLTQELPYRVCNVCLAQAVKMPEDDLRCPVWSHWCTLCDDTLV